MGKRTTKLPADRHADDGYLPASKEWMISRGWTWDDFMNFTLRVHHMEIEDSFPEHTTVYLDLIGGYFQILSDTGDSPQLVCECRTRADVRRIEAVFKLPTKEPK